jgi:hypothetical protein
MADDKTLKAERDNIAERCLELQLDNEKLRAALDDLYKEFSQSNDFRPDSKVATEARRALEKQP